MPISHYIKQFQDTLLLFFQDLVIRLCTILDEVPLLHEDRHKAAFVELISSYNTTHEFESNNFVEEGNTSSADLISIWILVATCTLGILILKRGLDFIRGVLSNSNPNSSVRDSVKTKTQRDQALLRFIMIYLQIWGHIQNKARLLKVNISWRPTKAKVLFRFYWALQQDQQWTSSW